ncbi:cation-binding hemerythrin HHE family protein [Gammaproteobacteria bacterium MOLA455]|nr:cation-binding hemerythrin HHE family protein [Gammaproteobacteria bacterium MOLA455]
MIDFECTPQVALEFMNREHRKAFDDANALKRLLDSALALRLFGASESQALDEFGDEIETEMEIKTSQLDSDEIEQLMQTLLSDTVRHFELEEESMEEYGFPARGEHSEEHRRVLQWMKDEHSLWSRDCSIETINHLSIYAADRFPKWLLNHIVTMDTVMASYIHRHGGTSL